MSITTVTALARDNNYRLVVVLAGTAKNLVQQTQERLEEHLGTEHWLVLPNPTAKDMNDLAARIKEWRNPRIRPEQHHGVLCVVMKHQKHIVNLAALLRGVDLASTNALIFDDEADQAGLNTKPGSGASAIYSAIGALRGALPRHTFLQYTATPQAPLLITLLDSLSPDFADTIEPGDGYVGGRDFFVERPALVQDIVDDEDEDEEGPPESLNEGLRLFFLGAAATRLLSQRDPGWAKERHRSMLVHPSRLVTPHRDYATIIEAIKRDWTNLLSRSEGDDEREELLQDFRKSHAALLVTFPQLPPLDELIEQLTLEISRAKITIVNKDGSDVPWNRHNTHILVGGQKLDRGYTVKGLTVTHMARDPGAGNYDTIQQRARFFGYKRKYLGLCRVILQPDVHEAFQQYVTHEEVLRDALRRHRGRSLKTWNRAFHLEPGYRLTRPNVHVEDYFRPSRGDWFKQQGPHFGKASVIADNNAALESFVSRIGAKPDEAWGRVGHHRGATTVANIQALLDELVPCGDADFSSILVAQFALSFVASTWDKQDARVYLMAWDKAAPRKRTPREETNFIELHQGPSPSGSEMAYPGDAEVRDEDRVTLQIHRIQVTPRDAPEGISGPLVLAFALRLPSHYTSDGFVFQPKRLPL
ncbi:MAG: hypothetical protein JNJ88_17425 [Planctomycetes bacterium]|nr:hypothetical protein [Planctomycetota bacterium]